MTDLIPIRRELLERVTKTCMFTMPADDYTELRAALAAQVQAEQCRDWAEDFGHENGYYTCKCSQCGEQFTGHKRRVICKVCAAPVQWQAVAYVLFRDGEPFYEADNGIVISNTPGDETDLYKWQPVYFTAPQPSAGVATDAARDLLAERQRQISAEGWTPEHDDKHEWGELAGAAGCYARHVNARSRVYPERPEDYQCEPAPESWPWDAEWWKPSSPRRDLVKAGALILAEIERLDRLNGKEVGRG